MNLWRATAYYRTPTGIVDVTYDIETLDEVSCAEGGLFDDMSIDSIVIEPVSIPTPQALPWSAP